MIEKIKIEETELNISQMKQHSELHNINYALESKIKTLKYEFEKNQQTLSKLNDSNIKFVKMLTCQKLSNDKHGIGFNNARFNYKSRTTFIKSSTKYRHEPSYSYCCKEGYPKLFCFYRRKDNYIIKNTFPFELREQVKQIWVSNGRRPTNMVHPEYAPNV